ncbi:alanine racemase [Heliorestis acidaminivorans]|uniref:Alanine racemase n=1 Tax=Heliorestis acidaminivorans TaxID=553427 RepID=A0A6I0F0J6_9FIRM|nr:alanine racemase [Heliorestis acidaminivorans]KAB2951835.1 alanine racemase [Heliorestis acidaminivorans]
MQEETEWQGKETSRPAWAEIKLENFAHNIRSLKKLTTAGTKFFAVLKADGYGHGAVPLAKVAVQEAVDGFVVAILDEALALRKASVKLPVLILGYTTPDKVSVIIEEELTQAIFTRKAAEELSTAAVRIGKKVKVHLKVDTGMGRVGFPAIGSLEDLKAVAKLPGLEVEGLFSHFATADEEDKSYAYHQLESFFNIVRQLEKEGLCFPMHHMANSAALLEIPQAHFNAVRAGLAIYGHYPSVDSENKVDLLPLMTLKARIVQIKKVPAQSPISYGCTYRCPSATRLATVPLGYADGVPRILSGKIKAYGKESIISQVGRICMDQMVFDIADAPLEEGDEIVLFGHQQGKKSVPELTMERWAELAGTIAYEIMTGISLRVPRIYL